MELSGVSGIDRSRWQNFVLWEEWLLARLCERTVQSFFFFKKKKYMYIIVWPDLQNREKPSLLCKVLRAS